jgi:hypothetical protein
MNPQAILENALNEYRKPTGYEGVLVEAAGQLEQIGLEAWPVLKEFLLSDAPECEYFLPVAYRLKGIPVQERQSVLQTVVKSKNANTLSRLLELALEKDS